MQDELAAKLKAGGCTLYFDTNEIRGKYADEVKAFNEFCRQVMRLRQLDDKAPAVKVFAVNHFEMMHQLRRAKPNFDESVIIDSLQTLEIPIVALDFAGANDCAKHLHSWFPTDELWSNAKAPARDRATIDWLISTHVCAVDAILVTSDGGNEFREKQISERCIGRSELSASIDSWLRSVSGQ